MAHLILMCGLPCAGKTTLAKQLEIEMNALRLTPDEWITTLYGPTPDPDVFDAARDPVEALQWQVAARALDLGMNVILDFGFWGESERDHFRAMAHELGASSEVRFVDAPMDELLSRLEKRNADLPSGTFAITADQLRSFDQMFRRPSVEECKVRKP